MDTVAEQLNSPLLSFRNPSIHSHLIQVDDCRRTHNYDQFICTFLSMLAEQGLLAGLVEHNMLIKRRSSGNSNGNGGSNIKSAISSKIRKPDKRKPKAKSKRKR